MAERKLGFELLRQQACEAVSCTAEFDERYPYNRGDSPIEKLLYAALYAQLQFNPGVIDGIRHVDSPEKFNMLMEKGENFIINAQGFCYIWVWPQAQLKDWRVDFLVSVWGCPEDSEDDFKWRHLIVECDGHEYHERTKEQAARDRSRDRRAVLADAVVFRFTGSEIWRDPWGCAGQIREWAEKYFPH